MIIPPKPTTLSAIDEILERNQDTKPRNYLGMSSIGDPCSRKLWYGFRHATTRKIPAKGLRAIQDGHDGEELMARRLRLLPNIELHTVDQNGKQFGFSAIGGHFKGHMDGAIVGLVEAPKTYHVWEHKSVNEKKFALLQKAIEKHGEKNALKAWDEIYYAQAICYMEMSGMTRHYLTCSTPGGRDYISVRTNADPKEAKLLMDKAESIIYANEPPPRISNDPAWYQCKMCDYNETVCHGTATPAVSCRSCTHSTPVQDAAWSCAISQPMADGCKSHRYIPILLDNFAEPINASQQDNWVQYRHKTTGNTFKNSADGYSSVEIQACQDKAALGDPGVESLRNAFDGEIVG